jgi:hypothetical protein
MILVSVECCESARRVTRVQHKLRKQRYGDSEGVKWTLVDNVPEFLAQEDVLDRTGKKPSIKRGQVGSPKLTVAFSQSSYISMAYRVVGAA